MSAKTHSEQPRHRETARLLLDGVRILDLTDGKGELCSRFLADLGADVVLVEPPGGAGSRTAAPVVEGVSLYFATRNANKRSVTADLRTDAGRELLLALADDADILIESGRPGELAALGVGPDQLRARNPRLVVVSITDFGQTGPYRDYTATNLVHMALSGVLARSGKPGLEPLPPPGRLAWEAAGIQAAWSALLAYANAVATGRGDHVDFSLYEAAVEVFDPGYGIAGSARASAGLDSDSRDRPNQSHLYPIMPCKDGYVRFTLLAPRQWRGMWGWMGAPEDLSDPRYDATLVRFQEWDRLGPRVAAFLAGRTRAELVAEAPRHNVPLAELLSASEVLVADHYTERGAFLDVEIAPGLRAKMANGFLTVDGVRAGIRMPAPAPAAEAGAFLPAASLGTLRPLTLDPSRPLAGLKVLDLGVIVVGAEVPRLFADMGADVVKVENAAFPDGMRQTPAGEPITASAAWGHRNKQSLGLNLRDPAGIAVFKELVAQADVVHSNFKPGTMESLGLGWDVLSAINPALVMADSSAMGSTGPWSRRLGYGPLVRASAALTSQWAYPDGGPFCDDVTVYPDHANARLEATAVLAAIIRARRTGRGAALSLAQTETIFGQMAELFMLESLQPGSAVPRGNAGYFDGPAGAFRCAGDDEWCAIDVRVDADWTALAQAIGRPELAADNRFATPAGRLSHQSLLRDAVSQWTSARVPTEVMTRLQAAGVPAGVMWRVPELLDEPQLQARGFWRTLHQPTITDPLPTENGPAKFAVIADPPLAPAPLQAEHTIEVLRRWLGCNDDKIGNLLASGAIEVRGPAADPIVTDAEQHAEPKGC